MDPIPGVPVFSWCHMPDASGDVTLRVLKAQFGDGYAQIARDGINNVVESWSLQFVGKTAKIAAIRAFLRERGGDRSFHWTPPLGELGLFHCAGFQLRHQSLKIAGLSATFLQTFRA